MAGMKTKPRWYIALLACLALLSVCLFISCRPAPPAIILFNASPSEIISGQSTTLKWDIKDAANVAIDQGVGEVAAAGSVKLSPAKTIAYTLTATNAGGTVSRSLVVYVNPPPPPPTDTTPPVIKNVSASSETETGAVITWATNEPGSSQIEYGQTTEYGLIATSDELTTAHSITLSGLEPNTEYHYRIESKDKAGNEASSKDYSFATAVPKSDYTLEMQSLEWGRRGDISFGSGVIPGVQYLFIKGTMRNTSHGSLKGVICTMNCWSGNTIVKYEIYVHRSPTLPGQFFTFDIQTDDDPTVDNVTVDFADSLGREITVTQK
jgi:hypothetical protein